MKYLLAIAFLLFANLSVAQSDTDNKTPSYPDAPDWTLQTQSGETLSYDDFRGKPLFIHFWGTWCPYCKKLHPGLERVRAKYEAQGLQVLGISVNEPIGANPAKVLKERGIHFTTLVEGDDVALEAFGVYGTPTTLFISPDGKILGSTMESNPDDPRFDKIAQYLVNLPRP
ncbi:TlpA family protein disulfide reductase [Glaciecola sp. XM2]|jgi:thiol-disulfide isomerase/thioredoxin|uniref:peroxiredoxin family protein n=1 Tax=Glaciecola sp. XM2 TaxID=1914931 RepID=UPI001BDF6AC2|nr:TlpA disulfide reductase family protein [Glaciecola sp. XM2]MBT1452083.1 TlpA family protein disulfide reductase [Glaciecola sp. XM2]